MIKIISIFISAIMTLSCLMLCVGADQNAAECSDPVVLISRMEKYEKYQSSMFRRGKIYFRDYGGFPVSKYASQVDPVPDECYEYYKSEAIQNGLPDTFLVTKYYNYSRDTFDKAIRQHFSENGVPYTSVFTDAIFSGNDRTVIETFMFPDSVLDMDMYNSTEPKARDLTLISSDILIGVDYPMLKCPSDIIREPLEKLDGWGYSDAYWLDYYEFIRYFNNYEPEWEDRIACSAHFGAEEYIVELDRRIDIYRARVGSSPETGDETVARAAVFAAGAVLAAAVPALILTVKHRRKEK